MRNMKLAGKTAIITGGTSGHRLATARLFSAEGARAAITGRSQISLDESAAALGRDVLALRADMTDFDTARRPPGEFDRISRTNVTGVSFTVQAFGPSLHDAASVLLVSSTVGSAGKRVLLGLCSEQGRRAHNGPCACFRARWPWNSR